MSADDCLLSLLFQFHCTSDGKFHNHFFSQKRFLVITILVLTIVIIITITIKIKILKQILLLLKTISNAQLSSFSRINAICRTASVMN